MTQLQPFAGVQDDDYAADPQERKYSRLFIEESAMAFSAMDCVLIGRKGVYASTELTSGERAYALLAQNGFRATRELTEANRGELLATNITAARRFADALRAHFAGTETVITPAPFLAPGWTQAEYLAFWEELIRTRVKAVYFNDAWELSNGCTFEFAVSREAGVPTFDARLRPISPEDGVTRIERAIADLEARGFDPERLRINLARLRAPR
jgi:hypothetical protein